MYSEEFLKALDLDPKVFNIGCDTESNSSESPNEPGRLIEGMDVIEHATVSHGCLDGCRLEDQEQANSDGELHWVRLFWNDAQPIYGHSCTQAAAVCEQ
jgi:hypothetical protein